MWRNKMNQGLFDLLSDADFVVEKSWIRTNYLEQEIVFKQGEDAESLFLVLEGSVNVQSDADQNDQNINSKVACIEKGEVFGEFCLFENLPREFTVIADKSCCLAEINRDILLQFFEQHPERGYKVMADLLGAVVKRLRKSNKRTLSLLSWGMKSRTL
jgi:CRP-like cAMP-binding protein